ncbi:hypothetical protein FHS27_001690 [Rhodopirellula rubra]|uniref:Uncharacterized protein n=1 Tax=Aporhodopirellula rubra TaxID=980271 RepID=A0A7W5DWN3_9BACT|nr:hypothetical protein [Aporhodopirellula rubra]
MHSLDFMAGYRLGYAAAANMCFAAPPFFVFPLFSQATVFADQNSRWPIAPI